MNKKLKSKYFIWFGDNLLEVDEDFYKAINQWITPITISAI